MNPGYNPVEFHPIKNSPERGGEMKKQKHPKYPRSSDGKEWRETLKVGDRARKVGGSYQATGTIRAVFITRNGEQRFVFDFDEPPGLLHIFGPAQIEPVEETSK